MMSKTALVIGSGGREHALAWTLSRSKQVSKVFVAPGNGGTEWDGRDESAGLQPCALSQNVNLSVMDFEKLIAFAQSHHVDLTVVGPEVPLSAGIVDTFQTAGLRIFGPSRAAARLEASKVYAKQFMQEHDIPTAAFGNFSDYDEALAFVRASGAPLVVKASGLAAGKGVFICDTAREAELALRQMMQDSVFGDAGDEVVIEERLIGREISALAFSDGKTLAPMIIARDYKRALDGDNGLNTGGMGAFAPATDVSQSLLDEVYRTIMQPVIDGMTARGTPYVGALYGGLMLTDEGPKALEFNCRFGDPETQVILPLLETDIYTVLEACTDGQLAGLDLQWKSDCCATVVLASGGYPGDYKTGKTIAGLDDLSDENVIVFHAGTARENGDVVTSGGRVLNVTAVGQNLETALNRAYASIQSIRFDKMRYRSDIGRLQETRI
jgi:phosphoribosylamine--glycine ligase